MTITLELRGVTKRYGGVPAVHDVSLTLGAGETLALLGPSGCGKSTLLRVVAGLAPPDAGEVLMRSVNVTRTPPEKRDLSLVFQDYALFPHLSVLRNVMYGPRARGLSAPAAEARAREALDLVGLGELGKRRVTELSGGQQQRVALARALAPGPQLLLLDEPLSNLDERLREALQSELRALFRRLSVSVLLVTHDQREALALADTLALMRGGTLVQVGRAREVYARPKSAWAAAFLGHRNLLPRGNDVLLVPEAALQLGAGEPCPVLSAHPDGHGVRARVAHPLGPLEVQLSAREALFLQNGTLRLTVREERCPLLPNDLDGELPASHVVERRTEHA